MHVYHHICAPGPCCAMCTILDGLCLGRGVVRRICLEPGYKNENSVHAVYDVINV